MPGLPTDEPAVAPPAIPTPGRRLRRAARILLFDPAGRLLLFRFTPASAPAFWATPGGECEPDETFAEAAVRELFEETGLTAADYGAPGPEIRQIVADFTIFTGERITADERYFRVHAPHARVSKASHTELERAIMQEHRWFTRHELRDWPETIFPNDIATML